jgi:hypothetical protein
MAYSNAVFYCDPVSGSDSARTALLTCIASNPSGSITRINKTAHGLSTGAIVDLTLFTSWLNNVWKITVVDADNFDLDTAVWQATADANGTVTPRGGMSKADAWKTYNRNTAATPKAGDTIRVIASPDPTLVGNADWTDNSKTVTLAASKTADITDCETAWTASANVTATAATTTPKMGTKYASLAIASGFTTGKVAYFATGTLDLSSYQQVSLWAAVNFGVAAGVLSLRLCSDTTGDVTVNTLLLPAIGTTTSQWHATVVDALANLGSSIQSIALYAESDPGTVTVTLDNIVACKASSSADSITHNSLIGKAHNLSWVASTTYAANTIRKPTQPNRNGYAYKVTAGGGGASGGTEPTWPQTLGNTVVDGALTWTCTALEETWYAIQSISGTTLKIDGHVQATATSAQVYAGTTETVATYKREPLLPALVSTTTAILGTLNIAGTAAAPIVLSGGWDRTSMATQSGETWISMRCGAGYISVYTTYTFNDFVNLSCVRGNGIFLNTTVGGGFHRFLNCHGNHSSGDAFNIGIGYLCYAQGIRADCGAAVGLQSSTSFNGRAMSFVGNQSSPYAQIVLPASGFRARDVVCKYGSAYALSGSGGSSYYADIEVTNLVSAGHVSSGISVATGAGGAITLFNPSIAEATPINISSTSASMLEVAAQSFNGDANDNRVIISGGTIRSVTDVRHTASGLAWRFNPTSSGVFNGVNQRRPLRLVIAKIACSSGNSLSCQIWTRRDNTNIKGFLFLRGAQIAGVGEDLSVVCEPTINTWTLSSALAFTPTEDGVVELEFCVYDGVDTSNNYWIDDLSVS